MVGMLLSSLSSLLLYCLRRVPIWGERADELNGSEFRLQEMAGWERVGEG